MKKLELTKFNNTKNKSLKPKIFYTFLQFMRKHDNIAYKFFGFCSEGGCHSKMCI